MAAWLSGRAVLSKHPFKLRGLTTAAVAVAGGVAAVVVVATGVVAVGAVVGAAVGRARAVSGAFWASVSVSNWAAQPVAG